MGVWGKALYHHSLLKVSFHIFEASYISTFLGFLLNLHHIKMQSVPLHLFQSYWNVNNCRNENPDKEIFFIHSVITTIQNYLKHELYLFPVPTVTHPVVIW